MPARCVVMGIGSTAFAKLLGQQTANATISRRPRQAPLGLRRTSGGGPSRLRAWEAIVWGDNTYCSFVLAAPTVATWPGVAGFIKAVFRWKAPPTQTMEISGIEASAAHDATLSTAISSYTGMMNVAARCRAGQVNEKTFVAGELAFVSATTNNQSVQVDFASWVHGHHQHRPGPGQRPERQPAHPRRVASTRPRQRRRHRQRHHRRRRLAG